MLMIPLLMFFSDTLSATEWCVGSKVSTKLVNECQHRHDRLLSY